MNLKIIKVVIEREYSVRVKKKSFLLTTFLVPVLFAALCSVPMLIMVFSTEKQKTVAVVDNSGIVASKLENGKTLTFCDMTGVMTVDDIKPQMGEMKIDAVLSISGLDPQSKSVSASAYSDKPLSVEAKSLITNMIDDAIEDYRMQTYQIDSLKQIMNEVKSDIKLATYTIDDDGSEKASSSEVFMLISIILSTVIYLFIAMFGSMVMQSVIEEKSSRVVEVLMSSVKATELMMGKIVGVALVALTQFILWVALTAVLVGAVTAIVGMDSLSPQEVAALTDPSMGIAGSQPSVDLSAQSPVAEYMASLQSIDFVQLGVCFMLFFLLGYLLYAALFAAVGSAVDNEADSQQLQIPLTIPLMIGFFVGLYAFKAPDSSLVWWFSMIPFTSPIVMLSRIPLGVADWEIVLSLVLLFLTFLGCTWISAKIYKVGILMFGKKSTFKDLWNWLRMK